jgi:hypothetical protein
MNGPRLILFTLLEFNLKADTRLIKSHLPVVMVELKRFFFEDFRYIFEFSHSNLKNTLKLKLLKSVKYKFLLIHFLISSD